jgi:peroxiredoxin
MAQLRHDYKEFEKVETVIAVLGSESPEAFASFWRDNGLPFIGVPDPGHTVLKRYGQEVKLFKLGRMPAQVLVDKNGMARFVHYGHDMTDIPSTEEVLGLIASLEDRGHDENTDRGENW